MTNPWLSMWSSAANHWAGAARGFWMAEMQRQPSAGVKQMFDQSMRFWTQAWFPPAAKQQRNTRRR